MKIETHIYFEDKEGIVNPEPTFFIVIPINKIQLEKRKQNFTKY